MAIDEARRAIFGEDGVKNPDFLLYPRFGTNLVVEVKGKRGKNARGRRDWENWVTTDDLDGLVRWQAMFGPGFRSILAFAYAEPIQPFPLPGENGAFEFRGLEYRFWAVGLDDYIAHLRSRGPAWKAVAMARRPFRRRVRPLREWLPMTLRGSSTTQTRQGTRTMTGLVPAVRPAVAPLLLALGPGPVAGRRSDRPGPGRGRPPKAAAKGRPGRRLPRRPDC